MMDSTGCQGSYSALFRERPAYCRRLLLTGESTRRSVGREFLITDRIWSRDRLWSEHLRGVWLASSATMQLRTLASFRVAKRLPGSTPAGQAGPGRRFLNFEKSATTAQAGAGSLRGDITD